ncbi:MAG: sulfatase-like hydrolase/transferase, partial [Verrucomicrobiae bacterium]|nr:sulfatase-like hydrolase/transferase [Verrucomicrobiae bacterium]
PVCMPNRASLLTGRYPDVVGVPGVIRYHPTNSWGYLAPEAVLLPQVLKPAGYHSAIIGKWHLGLTSPNTPTERGFDFFHGFLGDMMDDYNNHRRHGIDYLRDNETPIYPEGHATDLFSEWACEYLKKRERKGSPFLLYLAYNAPHTPIQPPAEWLEKVKRREPEMTEQRAKLVALIEHLDASIGRVLEAMKRNGQWGEQTLVVFTSDNGGQKEVGARNDPWRGGKQEMWEGGIRVATSVTWPGRIPAGVVNRDHLSLTMDFYPTLAEIAGVPVEHAIDGRSFAPLLLGKPFPAESDREFFWVRLEGGAKYGGLLYHAARRGNWKLLRNTGFEEYQLFNLESDPAEDHPVPREKAPRMYQDLFDGLLRHVNQAGKVPWQRENP